MYYTTKSSIKPICISRVSLIHFWNKFYSVISLYQTSQHTMLSHDFGIQWRYLVISVWFSATVPLGILTSRTTIWCQSTTYKAIHSLINSVPMGGWSCITPQSENMACDDVALKTLTCAFTPTKTQAEKNLYIIFVSYILGYHLCLSVDFSWNMLKWTLK